MAENQLVHKNDRIHSEARDTDWATLLGRAVEDITKILHSEIRLVVAGMKTVLDAQTDRVLGFIASGALMAAGAICLLAAIIMFLREYLLLPWWESFGITALGLFVVAIAVGAFASSRPKPPEIS